MAVMIASDLAKDMAGEPLLRGVSFKLERRDRLTIAGRNGAGKTTLLRMLSGETSVDGGEVVLAKGTRVALHDQRPPRERETSLRDYVLSGCKEPLELEAELAAPGGARWARATRRVFGALRRRAGALRGRRRLRLARPRAASVIHGLGFVDADLDRRAGHVLRRAAHARARWPARWPRSPTCCCSTSRPTTSTSSRSSGWSRRSSASTPRSSWSPTTAGSWRPSAPCVLELEAGRGRFFKGTWAQWRREQAAREMALGKAIEKQQAEIARMEAFVERFRAKATKARQAQSRVKALDKIERIERDPRDGRALGFQFKAARALGPRHLRARGRPPGGRQGAARVLLDDAELWLERGEHVSLVGPERHRQDDADRGARRPPRARRRQAAHRPQRQGRLPVPARRGARAGRRADRARGRVQAHRPDAQPGARAARALPVQRRGGREAARRPERRRAPAPVAGDPRPLAAPTS